MFRRACLLGALILLVSAPFSDVRAQGPYGGSVTRILLDSSGEKPLLAATSRGLFRFKRGRWVRFEPLGQTPLLDVVIIDNRVVALADNDGIWISDDGGKKWRRGYIGLTDRYGQAVRDVTRLCKDPTNPRRLYLGTAGKGFFVSRDQGHRWSRESEGLDDESPAAAYISAMLPPRETRPMIIGTAGEGLFIREGKRWVRFGEGLPKGLHVSDLAEDITDPAHLALGSREEGMWESRDGGQSWFPVWKGRYGVVTAVAFDGNGDLLGFFPEVGLMRTRQGKPLGRATRMGFSGINRLVRLRSGEWLAAMGNDGIYILDEAGERTETLNEGLDATVVWALARKPAVGDAPDSLWCGDNNGVFTKSVGSSAWNERDAGLFGSPVSALVVKDDKLFKGSRGLGAYVWDDERDAWAARSGGMGTSNTVNSMVQSAEGSLLVGTEGGVLRSEDEGMLWKRIDAEPVSHGTWRVAADPQQAGRYWATGCTGLYLTQDGGQSWIQLSEEKAHGLVYAGGALWVYRGRELVRYDGDRATPLFEAPQGDLVRCALPTDVGVWIGTTKGLWLQRDGEVSLIWEKAGILSLIVGGDDRLHAGTDGRGVVSFRLE